jgi:hypothetical protein
LKASIGSSVPSLVWFRDADLPAPEAHLASMRDFFATWADQLDT